MKKTFGNWIITIEKKRPAEKLAIPKRKAPASIYLSSNGNAFCYDENNILIPDLQNKWIAVYLEHIKAMGVDLFEIGKIQAKIAGKVIDIVITGRGDQWVWELKNMEEE